MSKGREVLFEFQRMGNSVKVTAFDVATLTEVTIVGPASTGQAHLKLVALKKLDYMLAKKAGG